jgi:5-methylcytosine-specific restriction endonuclease McrA
MSMLKKLKEKIIELKLKGLSYNQIQKKLNCSKGSISYHCGVGQKEKSKIRVKKYRNQNKNILKKKIEGFHYRKNKENKEIQYKNKKIKEILKSRIMRFSRMENGKYNKLFNEGQLLEKIGNEPKCYLTGRVIDLENPRSYNLDHIVPRTKGGDNSLENCGLACREANQAKHNLLLEDFIKLCKEVVQNLA